MEHVLCFYPCCGSMNIGLSVSPDWNKIFKHFPFNFAQAVMGPRRRNLLTPVIVWLSTSTTTIFFICLFVLFYEHHFHHQVRFFLGNQSWDPGSKSCWHLTHWPNLLLHTFSTHMSVWRKKSLMVLNDSQKWKDCDTSNFPLRIIRVFLSLIAKNAFW